MPLHGHSASNRTALAIRLARAAAVTVDRQVGLVVVSTVLLSGCGAHGVDARGVDLFFADFGADWFFLGDLLVLQPDPFHRHVVRTSSVVFGQVAERVRVLLA